MSEHAALAGERRRVQSIDILRGLVIVIMVLDHVRDYLHVTGCCANPLDAATTTPLLYITRWITHFCAPTFVFLSGASAWLQRAQGKSTKELSLFLLTRGLWLIFLELTIIGFAWSFSIPFLAFLQVIWAIGAGMVVLAALVWLPRYAVLAIGAAIIVGHNLLDGISSEQFGDLRLLWILFHEANLVFDATGAPTTFAMYPLLPWFGIMAFGYGLGAVFLAPAPARDRTFVLLGAAMVAVFIALRAFNLYGNPQPWDDGGGLGADVMRFLDVQKYPPSLMFVCATLGPVFLMLPLIERWKGPIARFFPLFAAVLMFANVLHIYLVHGAAIALNAAAGNDVSLLFNYMFNVLTSSPQEIGAGRFPLWVVYLVWVAVVAILYPLARWWGGVKRRRKDWWLSYL